MTLRRSLSCLLLLVLTPTMLSADFYKVNVTRVDDDLYKDTGSGTYIVTRYCYEYVYYQDAILNYEPYSYNNKLIFKNNKKCDVARLISK